MLNNSKKSIDLENMKDDMKSLHHLQHLDQNTFSPTTESHRNKLNLNFTFTNEKGKKIGAGDEDFYYELHRKLEENTFDIKQIKENLDSFKGGANDQPFPANFISKPNLEAIKFFSSTNNYNASLNKSERKAGNSKNDDFLNYLESLKNYRNEAISKTLLYNKRKRSIILIQKAFRGYLVRKAYREKRKQNILERCKKLMILKKTEYIKGHALEIIMKHMKKFTRKIKLRKKLIFKKFLNHCARLIQRFFKFRVLPTYKLKKALFQKSLGSNNTPIKVKKGLQIPNLKKNQTPDFSIIKNDSFVSSLKATSVLKTDQDGERDLNNSQDYNNIEIIRKISTMTQENYLESVPRKISKHEENGEDSKDNLNGESEPNKWEMRENIPVGTTKKNGEELNKWEMRENMPVGGSKNNEELNKWEMRENMPVGGSKNNGFGDDMLNDPQYIPSNKKPVRKHEFLKSKNREVRKKKENVSESLGVPEEKPKSHFKNFSKNLKNLDTSQNLLNTSQNLNDSLGEKELTNTLSALTYESPLKTNFKKKSQLFSPILNSDRSSPLKSQSPAKKPFLKKKTPKTGRKDNSKESKNDQSLSSRQNNTEEDQKERHDFLKKKSAAVINQKLDWKNVTSRTNCWLNKKTPPGSSNKRTKNQVNSNKNQDNSNDNYNNPHNNSNVPLNNKKRKNLNKTIKKGEIRETIIIKTPDDFRERMMMMKHQVENEYTSSNLTIPDGIPIIQINSMPLQMRNQQSSENTNGMDPNQLMTSLELKNTNTNTTNRLSEKPKEISSLSRIYKGSESSINSSVKYDKTLAVEELERAYRTNYFGKMTSFLIY